MNCYIGIYNVWLPFLAQIIIDPFVVPKNGVYLHRYFEFWFGSSVG